jgi:hypothetical protein
MSTKTKKVVNSATKSKVAKTPTQKATKPVASKAKSSKVVAKTAAPKSVSKKVKTPMRNTIAVIQFTPRGRRIRKYNSMSDAQRATGVNSGSISKAVRGITKTAGGFTWANA